MPLRVSKTTSFSFWVLRKFCCWSPVMSSWIMILQYTLDLLIQVFYLPISVVHACLCVPIKSLPFSLVSSHEIHSSAQGHQAWHQVFIQISKPSLLTPSLVPGLPHLVLWTQQPQKIHLSWGRFFSCRKALLKTPELSLWVCFYNHFCSCYYALDLEQILTSQLLVFGTIQILFLKICSWGKITLPSKWFSHGKNNEKCGVQE